MASHHLGNLFSHHRPSTGDATEPSPVNRAMRSCWLRLPPLKRRAVRNHAPSNGAKRTRPATAGVHR